jgi:carboxyl-terminal processing protease
MRDGEIVVKSIVPGGPAEEDGRLSPEDRILAVGQGADGTPVSVAGAVLRDVLNLIRGDAGTTVKLGVEKPDGRHDEYRIVRGEVQLPGLTTQIVSTRSADGEHACRIGVVRIPNFYDRQGDNPRSVAIDMEKALQEFKNEPVDAVLVDLRNNSGGSIRAMGKMTGLFLDEGPVTQSRRAGGDIRVTSDDVLGKMYEGPLAVLVNRNSAESEVLHILTDLVVLCDESEEHE